MKTTVKISPELEYENAKKISLLVGSSECLILNVNVESFGRKNSI